MKRLARNPEKFDTLDLFTALSQKNELKLQSPDDVKKFLEMIKDSFKASVENPILLHGKRMEALFGHLAAGMNGCRIVKSEDAGGVITDDEDMLIPDYRLTLKDGQQIFVEVKNYGHPNPKAQYLLNKDYVAKLQKYGELNNVPVYFAIYYRSLRQWALMPISSFIELNKKYATNAVHSIANSEMAILGDLMIGAKPPLVFELVADTEKDITHGEGNRVQFVIKDVKIYCEDTEITDNEEKNIAFYLIRYGLWDCGEPEAIFDENDNLQSVRYIFKPDEPNEVSKNGFGIIGNLNSMITEAFNEHTVYEQQVTAIDTKAEPDVFSVKIPEGYRGKQLPLWVFTLEANPNFKEGPED